MSAVIRIDETTNQLLRQLARDNGWKLIQAARWAVATSMGVAKASPTPCVRIQTTTSRPVQAGCDIQDVGADVLTHDGTTSASPVDADGNALPPKGHRSANADGGFFADAMDGSKLQDAAGSGEAPPSPDSFEHDKSVAPRQGEAA